MISVMPNEEAHTPINQGDVYWLHLEKPGAAAASYAHPHVVVQENLFNHSRIDTVIVCALTSNLNRSSEPGNLLLEAGEANLPKPSVVVVSQISTVAKAKLGEYIGTLSAQRVHQILAGIQFQQRAFFRR